MTTPTTTVKFAPTSDPLATSPTWVDISSRVLVGAGRKVVIERGNPDPLSPANVGKLTLTLRNDDRELDPTHTAGTWHGNLKPGCQIWVYTTSGGVDYDEFRGFISAWPQSFAPGGVDAWVDIVAYDALSWTGGATLSDDPYADYLLSIGTPVLWMRQADDVRWVDRQATYAGRPGGTPIIGDEQPPSGVNATAVGFNDSAYYNIAPSYEGSTTWSVGFWIKTSAATGPILADNQAVGGTYYVVACDLVGGAIQVVAESQAGGGTIYTTTVTSSVVINDGRWHHVVVGVGSDVYAVYVDGRADAGATTVNSTPGTVVSRLLVSGVGFDRTGADFLAATTLADLFAIAVKLTAAQALTLYQLGTGWAEEAADDRLTRYLDDTGWPAAWRDISTTMHAVVGDLTYNNRQLITALRELEASEQGRIFASKDGKIVMHGRYHAHESTRGGTSQATFTDNPTGSDETYRRWGFVPDDLYVRNDVTATNPVGTSTASDSTSITAYGRRGDTINTILSTVAQRQAVAQLAVANWKDAGIRVEEFDIGPPAVWATILALELGDRITAVQTPMAVGSAVTLPLIVTYMRRTIDSVQYQLTVGASPAPSWHAFILDTSLLDGTDVLAY